ncbi:group III truncated hemoglobin [Deinococcus detaillensis]|uniref:Group III truncated hemoglobin n=2 Tax=Deinococcus detaillensis TaxID=2592048 RepID=A0A553V5Z9_9DEIO|nr:group III truncated hemoglobin [Deinococcus detaillensis]
MVTAPIVAGRLFDQIGEITLRRVLWLFYERVMQDELLAPVFRAKLGTFPKDGWPVHMTRLEGFWRATTGGPSTYRGQPGPAHQGHGLEAEHFERWLALWDKTLREQLDPPEAEALLKMASRMRVNLERFATLPLDKP